MHRGHCGVSIQAWSQQSVLVLDCIAGTSALSVTGSNLDWSRLLVECLQEGSISFGAWTIQQGGVLILESKGLTCCLFSSQLARDAHGLSQD